MNDTKYTPGPWRLLPGFQYLGRMSVTLQTGNGKLNLARIFLNGPTTREEGTENAHLIAAAPELYEALKELLSDIGYSEANLVPVSKALKQQARAALAKADGGAL